MTNEFDAHESHSMEPAISDADLATRQAGLSKLDLFRRVQRARSAAFDDRRDLVFDASEDVLQALLDNEETTEEELKIVARRRDVSPELLRRLAGDKRTDASHQLRRLLAINPKLPASAGLRLVGRLFLFDIITVLTAPAVPVEVKTAAENQILQQYTGIALGQKLTMARRVMGQRLIPMMLNDPNQEVVRAALDNPYLTEALIANAIRRASHGHVVSLIADSPRWAMRPQIKGILLRSRFLSTGKATTLIRTLTPLEIKELANDPTVPMPVRTLIAQITARIQAGKR